MPSWDQEVIGGEGGEYTTIILRVDESCPTIGLKVEGSLHHAEMWVTPMFPKDFRDALRKAADEIDRQWLEVMGETLETTAERLKGE